MTTSSDTSRPMLSRCATASAILALVFSAVFTYLSYQPRTSIWSHVYQSNTLIEGSGTSSYTSFGVGFTAAFAFGGIGLCILPFLERVFVGRSEYLRRYGPPASGLSYPWKIPRISFFIYVIGPIFVLLCLWYTFHGFKISLNQIVYRNGPLDSFHRSSWTEIQSVDAFCSSDKSGFSERFILHTITSNISLGEIKFAEYGFTGTRPDVNFAKIVSRYHIHRINYYVEQGCSSADIRLISSAAK